MPVILAALWCGIVLPAHAQPVQPTPAGSGPSDLETTLLQALRGDSAAQFRLGQMHELGQGVAQSDAEAVQWYTRSAEQGFDRAQARLGDLFKAGRGVARRDGEAVKWYRRAAQQGNVSAQNSLAAMLYEGRGVAQDRPQARGWWQKAADQGDPVAKVILAQLPPDTQAPASSQPQATPGRSSTADAGPHEQTRQTPQDPCAEFGNGTPVTLRLSGYPQALGGMVLEVARGRATVQVMDMSAPPSVAGRRLDLACRSLVRAE